MASIEGHADLSFRCEHCGRANSVQANLQDFTGLPPCSGCGLTVQEGGYKMQDELANMFHQNMSISTQPTSSPPVQPQPLAPVTYSISQHYHHSAHIVAQPPVPNVSGLDAPAPFSAHDILLQHHVDPSLLLASQLTLFEQAAPDQRSRLIELWKIAPQDYVSYGAQELDDELGNWAHTTVEHEEEMARRRSQRMTAIEQGYAPITEDEAPNLGDHNAEPYIRSGYEALAERDYNKQAQAQVEIPPKDTYSPMGSAMKVEYQQAFDPAFQGREWWRHSLVHQEMENQYGMFDMMNQFRPGTEGIGLEYVQQDQDEEML